MGREEQRAAVRRMRESLIEELEGVYRRAFDAIGSDDMGEGAVPGSPNWCCAPAKGPLPLCKRKSKRL